MLVKLLQRFLSVGLLADYLRGQVNTIYRLQRVVPSYMYAMAATEHPRDDEEAERIPLITEVLLSFIH